MKLRTETDMQALAQVHPSLARGMVWCRTCGSSRRVDSSHALRHGWPKCCGYTMTIDSPEEQIRRTPAQLEREAGES